MSNRSVYATMLPQAGSALPGLAALAALLVAGCSSPPGPSAADLNAAYERALVATAPPVAYEFAAGEDAAALARLEAYFRDMTVASVSADTQLVYADAAFLYDNLAVIEGVADIEAYFLKAAGDVDGLSVEFLQTARNKADYFVRWKMTVRASSLASEPIVSYGVTQFRFDAAGRVLLHRDFWDAATGLYEYLPGAGSFIARIRNTLGAAPGGQAE